MSRLKIGIAALAALLTISVSLNGCASVDVGQVEFFDDAHADKPVMFGHFDDVMYRRTGDEWTVIAYQRLAGAADGPFVHYFGSYPQDPVMVGLELRVAVGRHGEIPRPSVLILRQGSKILADGPLLGEVKVVPHGATMVIRGEGLRWATEGAEEKNERKVGFELAAENLIE